jgi:hypothetical protein
MCKGPYHFLAHIPSEICPGVVLLYCMVGLVLVLWGNFTLISIVVALTYIPNSVEGFSLPLLHKHLSSICCCLCYWLQSFWLKWVEMSMLFWFAFPLRPRMLSISSYICWTFVPFLENHLFSSFVHLFRGLLILCRVSFLSSWQFCLLISCYMYS